jgi:cob(I)alamin adenosyltransferase
MPRPVTKGDLSADGQQVWSDGLRVEVNGNVNELNSPIEIVGGIFAASTSLFLGSERQFIAAL